MTELERRALLGDRKAQEECTNMWRVLPCHKCGKSVQSFENVASLCSVDKDSEAYKDLRKYFGVVCDVRRGGCGLFVCGEKEANIKSALSEWNTRPAPPIGRCEECKYGEDGTCESAEAGFYCGNFEPRRPDAT